MNRENGNMAAGLLILVVILMIGLSTFLMLNYATNMMNEVADFASTEQYTELLACGIVPPAALIQFQYDVPNLLIPIIYIGLPGLMIIIGILMFIAGQTYRGRGGTSVLTTRTVSSPNRTSSGEYAPGRKVKKTKKRTSTKNN